ncbi:hypothetical protein CAter282_3890 [Collimonas arenae]|uniref:Uncharacterized protein n=1 Tax=Collimonas arenae TaxID=279058 RepID=A0A127QNF9_9BURK|nr:hypothetical protein CAter282_3890 [Collimonas arenae]
MQTCYYLSRAADAILTKMKIFFGALRLIVDQFEVTSYQTVNTQVGESGGNKNGNEI